MSTCILYTFFWRSLHRRDDKRGGANSVLSRGWLVMKWRALVVSSHHSHSHLSLFAGTQTQHEWMDVSANSNAKRSHSPNAIVIYNSYHLKRSQQIRSLCDGRNVCLFVWQSEWASECVFMTVKASKSSSCLSCLCDLFSTARCGWLFEYKYKTSAKLCTQRRWSRRSFCWIECI